MQLVNVDALMYALLKAIKDFQKAGRSDLAEMMQQLAADLQADLSDITVDAEMVVRCKDCWNSVPDERGYELRQCLKFRRPVSGKSFCSCGITEEEVLEGETDD